MKTKPSVKRATPRPASSTSGIEGPRVERKIKPVRAPRIQSSALDGLERINHHAAGIDVGGSQNYVCVPANSVPAGKATIHAFLAFNPELEATVAWLRKWGAPFSSDHKMDFLKLGNLEQRKRSATRSNSWPAKAV